MGRNKYMKNKNCNKVSIITDRKFIPIDMQIFKGNVNDSKILQQQMNIVIENKENIKGLEYMSVVYFYINILYLFYIYLF